jgi:hypothetical protein
MMYFHARLLADVTVDVDARSDHHRLRIGNSIPFARRLPSSGIIQSLLTRVYFYILRGTISSPCPDSNDDVLIVANHVNERAAVEP